MAPEIIDLTLPSPRQEPIFISSDAEAADLSSVAVPNALNQSNKKKRKKRAKRPVTAVEDGEFISTSAETSREQSSERKPSRESIQSQDKPKSLLERIEGIKGPIIDLIPEEGEIVDEDDIQRGVDNSVESTSRTDPSSKKKKRNKKRKKIEGPSSQSQSGQETVLSPQDHHTGSEHKEGSALKERGQDTTRENGREDEAGRSEGGDQVRKRGRNNDRLDGGVHVQDIDGKDGKQISPRRRSRSPGSRHRDKKFKHSASQDVDLFFVDTDKLEASVAPATTVLQTEDANHTTISETQGLLLPAHVSLFGKDDEDTVENLVPSADEASDDEDFIEFLAYDDDRRVSHLILYMAFFATYDLFIFEDTGNGSLF